MRERAAIARIHQCVKLRRLRTKQLNLLTNLLTLLKYQIKKIKIYKNI